MPERTKYTGHRGLRLDLSSRKLTAVAELADSLQLLHLWIHHDFSYQSHTFYALLTMPEHRELSISLRHACLMWTLPMSSVCLGTPIILDVTFAEWLLDLVFFPPNPPSFLTSFHRSWPELLSEALLVHSCSLPFSFIPLSIFKQTLPPLIPSWGLPRVLKLIN